MCGQAGPWGAFQDSLPHSGCRPQYSQCPLLFRSPLFHSQSWGPPWELLSSQEPQACDEKVRAWVHSPCLWHRDPLLVPSPSTLQLCPEGEWGWQKRWGWGREGLGPGGWRRGVETSPCPQREGFAGGCPAPAGLAGTRRGQEAGLSPPSALAFPHSNQSQCIRAVVGGGGTDFTSHAICCPPHSLLPEKHRCPHPRRLTETCRDPETWTEGRSAGTGGQGASGVAGGDSGGSGL